MAGILLFWDGSYLFDALYKHTFFKFRIDEHCEMRRDRKRPNFKMEVVPYGPSLRVCHGPFNELLSADMDVAINPLVMDDEFKSPFLTYVCFVKQLWWVFAFSFFLTLFRHY